jgi:3-methyladenine DNA glycosylase AlkD
MNENIITEIRKALESLADPKTKAGYQRYFKEPVKFYGVNNTQAGKIAKNYLIQLRELKKEDVFKLCEELFKSDYCEEAFIASDWLYSRRKEYLTEDFRYFEGWINKYINNWAKCDSLCNHALAALVDMYPEHLEDLLRWTASTNRWVKRAAAVTLIIPARQGRYLSEIFKIADALINDKDDLVQKGYGWMLKAASESHQAEVFEYIMQNKERLPRTALRYAIEKMPADLKQKALAK